jgi:hypothetical protein
MAQRTTVSLVDDLDQTEAKETVEFGIDDATYEIDLSDANAAKLRDALADYVAQARRLAGRRTSRAVARPSRSAGRPRSSGRASVDREQNQAIREWARRHGLTVSERGRIPTEVTEAYHKSPLTRERIQVETAGSRRGRWCDRSQSDHPGPPRRHLPSMTRMLWVRYSQPARSTEVGCCSSSASACHGPLSR